MVLGKRNEIKKNSDLFNSIVQKLFKNVKEFYFSFLSYEQCCRHGAGRALRQWSFITADIILYLELILSSL